jgi:hypothetical protein
VVGVERPPGATLCVGGCGVFFGAKSGKCHWANIKVHCHSDHSPAP